MSSRSAPGFTLIETLVACGLLVAIALGTMQLFVYAVKGNDAARDQLLMGTLASARLDRLAVAAREGTLAITPADTLDRVDPCCSESIVQSGRRYVCRWRVAYAAGYGTDVFAIAVRVVAANGGGLTVTTMRRSAP